MSERYLPPGASRLRRGIASRLRLEEVVLARACAGGNEQAWECFLISTVQALCRGRGDCEGGIGRARAGRRPITRNCLGCVERGGDRISKLASYTGRGSLEGWLRTVVAQEWVNRHRGQRRLVSFDERSQAGEQFEAKSEALIPWMPAWSRLSMRPG